VPQVSLKSALRQRDRILVPLTFILFSVEVARNLLGEGNRFVDDAGIVSSLQRCHLQSEPRLAEQATANQDVGDVRAQHVVVDELTQKRGLLFRRNVRHLIDDFLAGRRVDLVRVTVVVGLHKLDAPVRLIVARFVVLLL